MGALVTLAFVVTFGLAGLVISAGGRFITDWIGWAGLAIGVALIALGVYQLATRRSLFANVTAGVRLQRSATPGGVLLFGVAYAVASLGCTLPVFMIVVGSVFSGAGTYLESVGLFLQYAAGMGLVLTVITLGIATFRQQTTRIVGRVMPYVESTGNVLLVFAGGYLVWYWTGQGGVL
jgi:cytochrome c biogenesis protein CcdA